MINKLIKDRRSPVLFSERPVEKEKLELLFEAARWAPSSNNQQPWRFIIAKKEDKHDFNRLFECLSPGNQVWVVTVPVLILSIAETISSYNNKMNKYAFHDVGLAVGNLLLQATSLGLFVHQMGGYDNDKARKSLKIPYGYDPVAMIAVGYLAESHEGFPQKLIEREKEPRKRKSLDKIVYSNIWGNNFFSKNLRTLH
jgi:nitroreductase